jgi:hypothetical protein
MEGNHAEIPLQNHAVVSILECFCDAWLRMNVDILLLPVVINDCIQISSSSLVTRIT